MAKSFTLFLRLLRNKFYFTIYSLLFAAKLLGKPKYKGSLLVSGKNNVEIQLSDVPRFIKVYFEGSALTVPCNPQHVDFLNFNLDLCCLTLVIEWDVDSVRTVVWEIY